MSRTILISFFILAAAVCWLRPRPLLESSKIDCQAPGSSGLGTESAALLQVVVARGADADRAWLKEDLQELMLAQGYQVVPAGSAAAAGLVSACVGWHLQVILGEPRVGEEIANFTLKRFGEPIAGFEALSGMAVRARSAVNPVGGHWLARRRLAAALDRREGPLAVSLGDGDAPEFAARMSALRLAAQGRLGAAAAVLEKPGLDVEQDSALSFRLGRILLAWAGDLMATSRSSLWGGTGFGESFVDQAEPLLARAETHLDRAIELDPRAAMAYFDRAKLHELQGRTGLAELDYRRARELWPAYGEASVGLACLRRARRDFAGLEEDLQNSLRLADPEILPTHSALLENLGKVQLYHGRYAGAAASLAEALEETPGTSREKRAELIRLVALAQEGSKNAKTGAAEDFHRRSFASDREELES